MTIAIDTNSLLQLIRYYLKFDSTNKLFNFFKQKIENREIIIIDEVLAESKVISKKIIVKTFDFLEDPVWKKENKVIVNTESIIPPNNEKFHKIIDNQLINGRAKNSLTPDEYEVAKEKYLKSADARLVLFGLDFKSKNPEKEFYVVTEETESQNDNKSFKKIPTFGKLVGIDVIPLPELLELYPGIDITYNILKDNERERHAVLKQQPTLEDIHRT